MAVIVKDLGIASAYGYAKSKGYTGTEEEFAELMASYADVAQQAEAAAQDAEDAKDEAVTAKTDAQTAKTAAQAAQSAAETASGAASTKASEAAQSAQTAAGSATAAGDSATAAADSATTAQTAAQAATTKASEASSSASAASTAKTGAETARTGAQTAQTAAETAQANAEAAASSVSASAAQIEQNTEDITGLKNDFTQLEDKVEDAYNAYVTETETGSIASFTDGADDVPVKDLTVAIEPVQDLHGYDNPWPAGGGKNLTDYDTDLTSQAGINMEAIILFSVVLTAGRTYTISCKQSVAVPTSTRNTLAIKPSNGTYTYESTAENFNPANLRHTLTYTPQSTGQYEVAFWPHTPSVSATYNEWQVEESGSFTSYAPYSNICPISGWTGANVTACGVNVWDEEWEAGGIGWSTGNNNDSETDRIRSKGYIPVKPNTSYWFLSNSSKYLWMYDESKTLITNISGNNNFLQLGAEAQRFTTKSNCYYVRFIMWTSYGTTYNHDISINYPSTDTAYHAYNGSSVSVDWTTEAGTVYGGTLDVTTGVLTVDRMLWTKNTTAMNNDESFPGWRNSGIKEIVGSGINANFTNQTLNVGTKYSVNTQSGDILFLPMYGYNKTQTEWQALALDVQVVAELATPQTYQLTPQEVSTVLGQNNIFADCGNVTAQYRADTKLYIDKVLNA